MYKAEILAMLDERQIPYTVKEHPAAHTIEEIDAFDLEGGECIAKNLFLRDEKKRNYYLVVLERRKRADLKQLRSILSSRPLSFASEEDLKNILGLEKGSVTPFGILNDVERKVRVIIDSDVFSQNLVGVHPNENTATVWLVPGDLVSILRDHGNEVSVVEVPES